jgi:hypothetical protein
MQEKIILKISAGAIKELLSEVPEKELIILNELVVNKKMVEDMLQSYYFKSRGRIFGVKIEKPALKDGFYGIFKVSYSIGHFNACADVDSHEEEKMLITFSIDTEKAEAILIGEYFPEREPDEI